MLLAPGLITWIIVCWLRFRSHLLTRNSEHEVGVASHMCTYFRIRTWISDEMSEVLEIEHEEGGPRILIFSIILAYASW
ncbi:hypothetical protein M758_1G290800 [Ceratodon purpureus]|nr:hypothetical protein M758_1G290800 [Ceratodon purpureus]